MHPKFVMTVKTMIVMEKPIVMIPIVTPNVTIARIRMVTDTLLKAAVEHR